MAEKHPGKRWSGRFVPGLRPCPWCGGRLDLQDGFPLKRLIPGELHVRGEEQVPEALRTVQAWVCSTPHCRFRERA
jgi:hypothetical protein